MAWTCTFDRRRVHDGSLPLPSSQFPPSENPYHRLSVSHPLADVLSTPAVPLSARRDISEPSFGKKRRTKLLKASTLSSSNSETTLSDGRDDVYPVISIPVPLTHRVSPSSSARRRGLVGTGAVEHRGGVVRLPRVPELPTSAAALLAGSVGKRNRHITSASVRGRKVRGRTRGSRLGGSGRGWNGRRRKKGWNRRRSPQFGPRHFGRRGSGRVASVARSTLLEDRIFGPKKRSSDRKRSRARRPKTGGQYPSVSPNFKLRLEGIGPNRPMTASSAVSVGPRKNQRTGWVVDGEKLSLNVVADDEIDRNESERVLHDLGDYVLGKRALPLTSMDGTPLHAHLAPGARMKNEPVEAIPDPVATFASDSRDSIERRKAFVLNHCFAQGAVERYKRLERRNLKLLQDVVKFSASSFDRKKRHDQSKANTACLRPLKNWEEERSELLSRRPTSVQEKEGIQTVAQDIWGDDATKPHKKLLKGVLDAQDSVAIAAGNWDNFVYGEGRRRRRNPPPRSALVTTGPDGRRMMETLRKAKDGGEEVVLVPADDDETHGDSLQTSSQGSAPEIPAGVLTDPEELHPGDSDSDEEISFLDVPSFNHHSPQNIRDELLSRMKKARNNPRLWTRGALTPNLEKGFFRGIARGDDMQMLKDANLVDVGENVFAIRRPPPESPRVAPSVERLKFHRRTKMDFAPTPSTHDQKKRRRPAHLPPDGDFSRFRRRRARGILSEILGIRPSFSLRKRPTRPDFYSSEDHSLHVDDLSFLRPSAPRTLDHRMEEYLMEDEEIDVEVARIFSKGDESLLWKRFERELEDLAASQVRERDETSGEQ